METQPNPANANSIASERLRRALERNRKKYPTDGVKTEGAEAVDVTRDTFKDWVPPRPQTYPGASNVRTSVARQDDYTFIPPVTRKADSSRNLPVRYKAPAENRSRTVRVKEAGKTFVQKFYFWGKILLFLVVVGRLFFSEGGVLDYLSSKKKLDTLTIYKQSLIDENKALIKEITLIETDASVQKKLVRDNLGFIGPDEYMLLFRTMEEPPAN